MKVLLAPLFVVAAILSLPASADEGRRVRGFTLETLESVSEIRERGIDDQYAELIGCFTARLDDDEYLFEDRTGSIRAELDDDREWYFRKDERVKIRAEVERDDDDRHDVSIEVLEVLPTDG